MKFLVTLIAYFSDTNIERIHLVDVYPHSLGTDYCTSRRTGIYDIIIKRNTRFPVSKSASYSTRVDNQICVAVCVYEGEDDIAENNQMLGKFFLDKITHAPAGVPKIEVTFKIDKNGILEVTVANEEDGNSKSLTENEVEETIEIVEVNDIIA